MATTTIKEFLVGLGFNINQSQYQKFVGGVGGATLAVGKLATAVEAAAATIVVGVEQIAERFEDLYYASQRIGTTITNIESLEYAARQIGVAGGEATSALEHLASMMRTQPGTEGLLRSMGVQTRDATGAMRDMSEIEQDFVKRLGQMPFYVAKQFGDMFGISERTLFQLIKGQDEATQKQETYRQKIREWGVDLEDVGKKSREFMNRLRDVGADADLLTTKLQSNLMPVADHFLQIMQHLIEMARTSPNAFAGLRGALEGILTALDGIIAVLEGRWPDAWKKAKEATSIFENWKIFGNSNDDTIDQRWDRVKNQFSEWWGNRALPRGAPTTDQQNIAGGAVMEFFQKMGWSKAQAAGIAGNLQAESGFNPMAKGDGGRAFGVAQWHPDRQAAFQQWAGKPIQGSSLWEQLGFIQHELTSGTERAAGDMLRGAKTASEAAGIFSQNYERPADTLGEINKRGVLAERLLGGDTSNVTVNQKTDIHVNGGDAAATGRAVSDEQTRVNADLARNLGTAVR
jgi:hypothetical protein